MKLFVYELTILADVMIIGRIYSLEMEMLVLGRS